MDVIIDTHALIWFLEGADRLSFKAKEIIEKKQNKRYVCVASIWEITIKSSLGKLNFKPSPTEIEKILFINDIKVLGIKIDHLTVLQILPHHHRDPFDRLLIAQAISEDLSIISADQHFKPYPAVIIWD
ncbi:MAG: type II toxin-antitoxin system VapC family toxin [Mucilaginibacter sp.]